MSPCDRTAIITYSCFLITYLLLLKNIVLKILVFLKLDHFPRLSF